MHNKDFRSRLLEYETTFNPDAWTQMSQMLDTLPVPKQEKTKKNKLGLLLLVLPLLSFLVFFIWRSNLGQTASEESPEKKISQVEESSDKIESVVSTHTDQIAVNQNGSEQIVTPELKDSNSDLNKNNLTDKVESIIIGDQTQQKINSDVALVGKEGGNTIIEKDDNYRNRIANQAGKGLSETEGRLTKAGANVEDNSVSENEHRVTDDNQDNLATLKRTTGGEPSGQGQTPLILGELILLDKILYDTLNSIHREKYVLRSLRQIQLTTTNKLFWTGGVGGSDINGNKGYYVGAGLFWDVDKVIGLETNLSFSSAWNINGTSNSSFDYEQRLNLTAWIHLNLFRRKRHKVSLELAPSIVAVWTRIQNEAVREYRGIRPNYKAGASYTYFLHNGNGLGIKGAFSLHDSGFIALKYFKKF